MPRFEQVSVLRRGMEKWKRNGYPVETVTKDDPAL
jgi:3-mercaptopyruvate sulfurtransferase SseA